jgi:heat shock protein HspQ
MSLLVHYIGWSNVYDEVIEVNSQRLASYRFYTLRKDIPHYVLADNEMNHLQGYVVERDIAREEESDSSENRDSMDDIEIQLMNEEESEDQ